MRKFNAPRARATWPRGQDNETKLQMTASVFLRNCSSCFAGCRCKSIDLNPEWLWQPGRKPCRDGTWGRRIKPYGGGTRIIYLQFFLDQHADVNQIELITPSFFLTSGCYNSSAPNNPWGSFEPTSCLHVDCPSIKFYFCKYLVP